MGNCILNTWFAQIDQDKQFDRCLPHWLNPETGKCEICGANLTADNGITSITMGNKNKNKQLILINKI